MNYEELKKRLRNIKNLKVENAGRSWDDRNIFSVSAFFDKEKPWVIVQAGIHSREHLSCDLVMYFVNIIDDNFEYFRALEDFPNICFVPMVNPDGIQVVHYGIGVLKNARYRKIMWEITRETDIKLIKCNARGVDINNNFNAKFNCHKCKNSPATHGYKGAYPESEKETRVLVELTKKINPIFTMSYHLKGEEIYYDFGQCGERDKRDFEIAQVIENATSYNIKKCGDSSFGGYKDWCVEKFHIPAVTIEVGSDEYNHPVPKHAIYEIIEKNTSTLMALCVIVKIWKEYKEKI